MLVRVRLGVEGGHGTTVLPGYQRGGEMFAGDLIVGKVLSINEKLFQVVRVESEYICNKDAGLGVLGGMPLVVLKQVEAG